MLFRIKFGLRQFAFRLYLRWRKDRLAGVDFSYLNLRGVNLSDADLRGAVLSRADLSGADLRGAVLAGANLRGTLLFGADLSGADLSGANVSEYQLSTVASLEGVTLPNGGLVVEAAAGNWPTGW